MSSRKVFFGRIGFYCLLVGALVAVSPAAAETIRLKNGRVILADSFREVNGRIEYTIGENTYAIPKSSVLRIDTGGTPVVTSKDDLPSAPPKEELAIHDHEELDSLVIVNGKVDTDFLNVLEKQGNADKTAYSLILASMHERSSGKMDKALSYIEHANNLLPDNGIVLTHYGSAFLQMGRPKEAASMAERASKLMPDLASAFSVLGYADYQLNKSKEAIRAFKRSLELQPDPSVEQILAKAQRELAAEGQFSEETSSHFTMRYEGGQAGLMLRGQILRTLEQHFDDLSRDLSYTPRQSIAVVLYTDKQYFDVTQAPAWTSALNDGKLRMPISGVTSMTSDLSRVLKHELTHSFINQLTKGRCPAWLNEGVAQLEEPRSTVREGRRLTDLYTSHHNIPLNQLEAAFINFSGSEATVAYAQSLLSVEYIRDTYGMSDLAAILKRLGEGQSTESALRSTIHSGYGQLEQELTAFLKRTYGD